MGLYAPNKVSHFAKSIVTSEGHSFNVGLYVSNKVSHMHFSYFYGAKSIVRF